MNLFARRYQENVLLTTICKYVVDIIMTIVAAYVLVTYICCHTTAVGNSMDPTIKNDETVLVNRISYCVKSPERFDVIAFKQDSVSSSKVYIKRVIGLPGETVQIIDGSVYIDGNKLADDNETSILTEGVAINEVKLGADEYFVLGDNRNNSEDSRFATIGMVKEKNIVGKVWMIVSPFDSMSFVK